MKRFILSCLLCITSAINYGQIKGKVIDNNNEPVVGATIIIKGSEIGTDSDIDGKFKIENISGKQTLIISSIGYKTKEIIVSTPNNSVSILLFQGNEILQEVVVAGRTNKFSRKKTAYVSKLPLNDLENAQVYSTITSDLLESQIVTNLEDALNNSTGISKLWEATGRAPGEGTGYFSVRGFATQSKLVDGMPGFTLSALDPSYIERIEVVKGPSATLFGSTETSLGGLINIVTKKPFKGEGGRLSYTAGSFGLNRFSIDFNTPMVNSDKTYLRVNATYLTQDSFQDTGFKKTFFVAPSITHKVNNRLNLSFGFEFAQTSQTNPSMLFVNRLGQDRLNAILAPFGVTAQVPTNVEELNVDPTKSFTSDDVELNTLNFNTRSIVDYKLSDQWTSQTIFASSYASTRGFYQYNIDGGAAGLLQISGALGQLLANPTLNAFLGSTITPIINESVSLTATPSFARIFDKRNANATNFNLQQNFIGDFKIGDFRNRFVGGLDFVDRSQHSRNQNGSPIIEQDSNLGIVLGTLNTFGLNSISNQISAGFAGFPYFEAFLDAQGNITSPVFTPNATYDISASKLEKAFRNVPVNDFKTNSRTYAAYVSNVINVTPELTVNLGLRVDHFDQDGDTSTTNDDYTKTTLSPKAGLVYQVIPNELSVFGNYQTGFVNKDPVVATITTINPTTGQPETNVEVQNFQPVKANQFEGGIKTNLFNNRFNLGASYYHIIANNITTTDPMAFLTTAQIDIKEVVSKGIEVEMNANPFSGLNIRGSYAYNDSKITDAFSSIAERTIIDASTGQPVIQQGNEITELLNRRPEEAGPQHNYNFWVDYRFGEGTFLENFGFGAGFNGASEHLTINNAISGTFELPSYTVYNTGAYYEAEKFRIGFKINNLTDKVYYKGWSTVNAQPSRAYLGSISYKF
ncbi:TonB-dependent receptor [Tenacibaculum sp. 190524A05c]|uniref:Iron complex outermembrane recepter protein n=1 Tax=Tenacibaculum platacis TaxID=3137852 RepID=A0ABM9NZK1_9FLAO